ncbi:GNAT family N-acetyltransferase [Moritella sp.]|uniref:GNAT family N-acetyltransferase n=1 Tax=Moritella sp. TaxID=78556 RepID=UPI001D93B54A|nr:GNAT family N-acetyltransferase [Moritella sp.]MCJ8348874.1 GNAT family N-acetyltransferase [Moritella sp.]NQZ38747.1 GNAT family N-acetyltransferase [Moritella sp.]
MEIRIDDLKGKEVALLLQEHHEDMLEHTPAESVHALDLTGLQAPEVTFWSAWINGDLAGCGAMKVIAAGHVEIKSMRTDRSYLRQGVARKLLTHILATAKNQGITTVSLETGTPDSFIPAQKLYRDFGFNECAPFANYREDPYSLYMTKTLITG